MLSPVITDTTRSPHSRLRPVAVNAVTLDDRVWSLFGRLNRFVILPYQYRQCEVTGRLENFRRAAAPSPQGEFQGLFFNDSDVYKWLEAASWTLASGENASVANMVDTAIGIVAAAQQPDGYLNTYFMFDRAGERWSNLTVYHELYCAGHLIQAAVAHKRATNRDDLLTIARRFADLICDTFGPEAAGKRPGTDGHPEIEMALVELYRLTGERRYLDQALYFIDARGHGLLGGAVYCQDETPFRQRHKLAGHAVRALYLCAGAADVYAETGETVLLEALERQWQHMTTRQMYISGGLGARHEGESFGDDYELPNDTAYAETCAAIASVMWNWRMLLLHGEARYADLMEHTLYNAVLPGLALDGQHYFYVNPLAADGTHRRQPWFNCACCPPNLARLLAQMPGYVYSVSDEGVWAHLYAQNDAQLTLTNGQTARLKQRTNYPWDGRIDLVVEGSGEFSLFLRIPGWCDGASLAINTQPFDGALTPGTYVEVRRQWQSGDRLRLTLPMPVRAVESHPRVTANTGRVALMRGPILYCVEAADNPGLNLDGLTLCDEPYDSSFFFNMLGAVIALHATAHTQPPAAPWGNELYRTTRLQATPETTQITAIPYFAWGNREAGPMQVWLRM
ncbi:MAG: glycoside hydrolase family 127 protein [Chloroflexi bacterium]|nr:glycoside hydrolase family 127 protein [Chloroflexota bacterium]